MTCIGCDGEYKLQNMAPVIEHHYDDESLTFDLACRNCIKDWIQRGILWQHLSFEERQQYELYIFRGNSKTTK